MSYGKVSFFLILLVLHGFCKKEESGHYKILDDQDNFFSTVVADLNKTIRENHITCENYRKFCEKQLEEIAKLTNSSSAGSESDRKLKDCKELVEPLVCPRNSRNAN